MRHRLSLIVVSTSGSPVRQFTLPRIVVQIIGLLAVGLMVTVGLIAYDYNQLIAEQKNIDHVQQTLADRQAEIAGQRRQIQHFAQQINELKQRLVALNQFEKKVRIIANLESENESEGLFGIGGSPPEDLNPRIELEARHNGLVREMHQQAKDLDEAAGIQTLSFESLLASLEDKVNLLAATPAIRPAPGWVTSPFGYRTSPFTGQKEFHSGLDIANQQGTPVKATADGVVSFAGRKSFLGKVLVIDHGHGMVTRYAHLAKIEKKSGQHVKRGEVVAEIGATGRSTGPHLHYEILLNGLPVNPENYILN